MSKWRRAAKVDINQKEIVSSLRLFPGITVELSHDDILVGYKGRTYWFEIKSGWALKKGGDFTKHGLKASQVRLLKTWTGHYKIVTCLDDILTGLGITKRS